MASDVEQWTVVSVCFFGPCFNVSSFGCFMDVIAEADVSDAIREMTRKRRLGLGGSPGSGSDWLYESPLA